MNKGRELYSGKAKSVFLTADAERLVLAFRDDASAFDGTKKTRLDGKGELNNRINAYLMERLERAGVATHFIARLNAVESLVRRLDMIPIECVARNLAAGSICRRLGVEEGFAFDSPVFEFFLKDDALHDPLVNEFHARAFGWATDEEMDFMRAATFRVNDVLRPLFADVGIVLVDFKLEFGRCDGRLLLGDEFTPDGCRLWDAATREKLDKDRFRRDLGGVVERYVEVAERLGVPLHG